MKIVVIGGTGLIGARLVSTLRLNGHDAVAALPGPGVDTISGKSLPEVLGGAAVVIDASTPPCCGDGAVVDCFATTVRNLLEHEIAAGVNHHVALSAVRTGRLSSDSGYFRARCAQEQLIKDSRIPYSIVRATPFFESLGNVASFTTYGAAVHVPPVLVQPVAADDVVRLLVAIAADNPLNGSIEIGGPEPFPLDGLVQRVLGASNDPRAVTADANARYFGARLEERSLVAGDEAELGEIRFDDWIHHVSANGAVNGSAAAAARLTSLKTNEFRVDDVPPGSVLLMGDVAVFSVAGGFAATQAMCTHKAGPLSEGTVDDMTVTCPLHGSRFDIWTGAVLHGPAKEPLKTYRVTIDGGIGRVETAALTMSAQ